jgi:uncharacterized lipoprotein YbaY
MSRVLVAATSRPLPGRVALNDARIRRPGGRELSIGGNAFRRYILRLFGVLLSLALLAEPAMAQNEDGLTSLDVSRCAGRLGLDIRSVDEAFVAFALDGLPWISAEEAEVSVGSQVIWTTITGSGWMRRRGGTTTFFRYTCLLDANRQALMTHVGIIDRRVGDSSPPATTIFGSASFPKMPPLPRGIELRVQVLDIGGSAKAEVIAEQVVRSGWSQPIPFALRIPKTESLKDRKLALTARLVLAHKTVFALASPHTVDLGVLDRPVELVLEPPPANR